MTTRRALLKGALGGAGLLTIGGRAWAFGKASRLDIGEWVLSQGTLTRPSAWRYLLSELDRTTSVVAEPRSMEVDPTTPALAQHPFAVLQVDGPLPRLDDELVDQFTAFLSYGGFLFIDDTTGGADRSVDASVRRFVRQIFPTRPLATLPAQHALHRAFFLLKDGTPGRLQTTTWMEAVTVGNLAPVVYGRNDLSGALLRTVTGQAALACSPGGERQRREAIKVGINLVMYALTANYKLDQAHVAALIQSKRLEP